MASDQTVAARRRLQPHRDTGHALADRLAVLRIVAGITQKELGAVLGLSAPQVSATECGRRAAGTLAGRWLDACGASDEIQRELLGLLPEVLELIG